MEVAQQLRVLHVLPTLRLGGAPRGVIELVEHIDAMPGIKPYMCVLGYPEEVFFVGARRINIEFLRYRYSLKNAFQTVQCVLALRRLIKTVRPEIIHSHLLPADLIAGMAVLGTDIQHIAHIRDTREWLCSTRPADLIRKLLYRWVYTRNKTYFVAVSAEAGSFAARHLQLPADRLQVILNGVDISGLTRALPSPARAKGGPPFVIGSAGRFVPAKDHGTLIRCVAGLVARGFDLKLRLAGAGGLEPTYRQMARVLQIDDRMEILTDVRDMASYFDSLDVFVLPSKSAEGLPRVILEAMACGIPVIATRAAGVSEVVQQGVTGILIERGDVEGLSNGVIQLMRDRALRVRMAEEGRTYVMTYCTSERVADEVVGVYRKLRARSSR